jgi:hypothetical protein
MEIDFEKGMKRFAAVYQTQLGKPPECDFAIERIAAVAFDVAEAENKGLFVPVPTSEPQESKDWSRIKTIRNRLHILGYLEKDSGRGNLDEALKEATRAFQKEAGLEVDGWVGAEETWPALQELVSFETPIQLWKWYDAQGPKPALRRAIALRLFALGLKKHRPAGADEDVDTGLRSFGRIWRLLNLGETRSQPGLNREWLELLFDMDGITRRLSQTSSALSEEDLVRVHTLVINAAKIELWLMGYPVEPSGYDLEERETAPIDSDGLTDMDVWLKSKTLTRFRTVKKNMKFHKALHRFWIDHGRDDDTADEFSVFFLQNFPNFFKIVDAGLQTGKELNVAHRQEDLEAFLADRKDQIPTVWQTVRTIGARIWDGVRRVWGWFKQMLTVFKKKILKIGTNLSRIIYDFALESFTVVSDVFKSIGTVVEFMVNPIMPGSDTQGVVFRRGPGFDPRIVIHNSADGRQVINCCETLKRKTRIFAFGCHVIGTFVSILAEVFRKAWTAYFGLVLTLIKLRAVKYRLKSLAQEYQALFPI